MVLQNDTNSNHLLLVPWEWNVCFQLKKVGNGLFNLSHSLSKLFDLPLFLSYFYWVSLPRCYRQRPNLHL